MAPTTAPMRQKKVYAMTKVAVKTWCTLPFEIWSLICSLLCQNDLTVIARVSSILLRICRPILYRLVVLRNDSPNLQLQLRVVRELATGIRQLTLFTAWVPRQPHLPSTTWVDFNILSRFTSLRTLILIGSPFTMQNEQTKFLAILRHASPLLNSFTYVPHDHTAFRSPFFELSGLENVSWHTYLADSGSDPEPQAVSMLSASAQTLRSLSFPNCPGYSIIRKGSQDGRNNWDAILSLRFPRLVSLSLGLMYPDSIPNRRTDTRIHLTRFLVAHPTLRDLTLGSNSNSEHHYEGINRKGKLVKPDFLPSLRSFETHPTNLTIMIRQKVRSVQELTKLSILYHCGPGHGVFEELLVALHGTAGFPFLNHLKIQFSTDTPHTDHTFAPLIIDWVRRLGAYCPAVLTFSGHLCPSISPWHLGQALHPYKLLETIDLPKTTLANPGGLIVANDFIPLADACRALYQISIKTAQNDGSKYVLGRNERGTLCAVTVSPRD